MTTPITLPSFQQVIFQDIGQLALPTLQDIQTRLTTINANSGNPAVVTQQWNGIIADVNALALNAPLSAPVLIGQLIGLGAGQGANLLGELISQIQAAITPATPVPSGTPAATAVDTGTVA